jgi:hypothetical protein
MFAHRLEADNVFLDFRPEAIVKACDVSLQAFLFEVQCTAKPMIALDGIIQKRL